MFVAHKAQFWSLSKLFLFLKNDKLDKNLWKNKKILVLGSIAVCARALSTEHLQKSSEIKDCEANIHTLHFDNSDPEESVKIYLMLWFYI